MKLRTAVFLVAISATACTAASNQPPMNPGNPADTSWIASARDTAGPGDRSQNVNASDELGARSRSHFSQYSSRAIPGQALKCVTGMSTDEDGMNQKPVVRLVKPNGRILWATTLRIPDDYYQGRAVHCIASTTDLYVLLQYDTQPAQSLSQSQLQIARLSLDSGLVQKTVAVVIPGATTGYSAWVSDASADFSMEMNKLVVNGEFFLMSDESEHRAFKVIVDTTSLE